MKLPYCTKDWKGSSGKALLRYFSLLAPELTDDGICSESYGDIGLANDGGHEGF